MTTKPQSKVFTIKMTPTVSALADLALTTEAPDEKGLIATVKGALNRLSLRGAEAATLASALIDYADGHLREDTDDYRTAYEFAYALGDVAVTMDEATLRATRELQEAVEDERAHMDAVAARADNAFNARMNWKRDEGLREVFTGGPGYKFNIWTGKSERIDATGYDLRGMENEMSRTPVYMDPEVRPAPPRDRVRHLGGVVGTSPVSLNTQHVADAVDALGPLVDHNTQMKGAAQLVLDQNRAAGSGTAGVGDLFVKPGDHVG